MKYELRKMKLQSNLKCRIDGSGMTGSGKQTDLFKTTTHFDENSVISIYLPLFERQIADEYRKRKLVIYT